MTPSYGAHHCGEGVRGWGSRPSGMISPGSMSPYSCQGTPPPASNSTGSGYTGDVLIFPLSTLSLFGSLDKRPPPSLNGNQVLHGTGGNTLANDARFGCCFAVIPFARKPGVYNFVSDGDCRFKKNAPRATDTSPEGHPARAVEPLEVGAIETYSSWSRGSRVPDHHATTRRQRPTKCH